MTLRNLESIPGQSIVEHYGLEQVSTIRAKHVVRDFMAGLKNIVGGELKGLHRVDEGGPSTGPHCRQPGDQGVGISNRKNCD